MNIAALISPRSIALVGASSKTGSVGNDVLKNLVTAGFAGKIFPINPKVKELYGLRVLADISELTEAIDLLIVAIPAAKVPAVLRQASAHQVQAAIILSAGFKEVGALELEKEIVAICQEADIALLGPNCLGLMNPSLSLNASFAPVMPEAGPIAFLSQSGALGAAVLDIAKERGLGFSQFVSLGNKAALSEIDLLKYFATDPSTKVICCYVEALDSAQDWLQLLRQEQMKKPIIILKSGRTLAGSQAAHSHTGALNTGDNAYQALFAQAGIIRAESLAEMLDYAAMFMPNSYQKVIRNVAVLTNAGGPAVLATDVLEAGGLALSKFSEATKTKFQSFLPAAASLANPVDLLGDASADLYSQALSVLFAADEVDSICLLLTPQSMTDPLAIAQNILAVSEHSSKPLALCFMGAATVHEAREVLRLNHQALFEYPESAAKALLQLQAFSLHLQQTFHPLPYFADVKKTQVAQLISHIRASGRKQADEWEAREILSAYHLPLVKAELWQAAEVFPEFSDSKQYAIKIVSPDILHKTEVAGVKTKLQASELEEAATSMLKSVAQKRPTAKLKGILISEMLTDGLEMILGYQKNPLGQMLMFGWGGIYVELLKDVQFRFLPLAIEDSKAMIDQLQCQPLFYGFRGREKVDLLPVVETMTRLSQLLTDFPAIAELDINPLKVYPDHCVALDVRIVLE